MLTAKTLLFIAALLLCCGARVARAQEEPCRLERAVAPDYGGVMLGMRVEELARMFPGSEELQKGPSDASKPFVVSLGGLELGVRKEQFRDVAEVVLTFLGGTLQRIDVRYRQPTPWSVVTDFSAQASKRLAVPADAWSAPASDAEKQSRVLDCHGFSVVVRMDKGGPSTLSIVDTTTAKPDASGATAVAPASSSPAKPKRRPRGKGKGGAAPRPSPAPGQF